MATKHAKPYEVITVRILEALEKGVVPWRKPWSTPNGVYPVSVGTKRPYKGLNALMLALAPFGDNRWITFKKARDLGGTVKAGEKGMPVTFWKFLERETKLPDGTTEVKGFPLMRYYTVFNVEQCDGLSLSALDRPEVTEFDAVEAAECVVAGMLDAPTIDHDGADRAYYIPRLDSIHLPLRTSFADAGEYYSTVFHELGHSTGHESRLNRSMNEPAPFGSPVYSKEELVAEFTSAFLCHEVGIENTIENSAAYINGWKKKLGSDPRLVISAASLGQKAADRILDLSDEKEESKD